MRTFEHERAQSRVRSLTRDISVLVLRVKRMPESSCTLVSMSAESRSHTCHGYELVTSFYLTKAIV